jgi:hypothetical protein
VNEARGISYELEIAGSVFTGGRRLSLGIPRRWFGSRHSLAPAMSTAEHALSDSMENLIRPARVCGWPRPLINKLLDFTSNIIYCI